MHNHDQPTAADTDHDRAREQLSAWLDGELPEAEARFKQAFGYSPWG